MDISCCMAIDDVPSAVLSPRAKKTCIRLCVKNWDEMLKQTVLGKIQLLDWNSAWQPSESSHCYIISSILHWKIHHYKQFPLNLEINVPAIPCCSDGLVLKVCICFKTFINDFVFIALCWFSCIWWWNAICFVILFMVCLCVCVYGLQRLSFCIIQFNGSDLNEGVALLRVFRSF